jgi:hypothetical protein
MKLKEFNLKAVSKDRLETDKNFQKTTNKQLVDKAVQLVISEYERLYIPAPDKEDVRAKIVEWMSSEDRKPLVFLSPVTTKYSNVMTIDAFIEIITGSKKHYKIEYRIN